MTLPYSDPSNPALPSPLFSDVTAVRADHMRANNAAIFADLSALDARLLRIEELEATVSSGETLTLVAANKAQQLITGVAAHTVVLPVVTTLYAGFTFIIINDSTQNVTVNSSGANLVKTILPGRAVFVTCVLITGTTAASWKVIDLSGDVAGPSSVAANEVPIFSDTTGKALISSGQTIAQILAQTRESFGTIQNSAGTPNTVMDFGVGAHWSDDYSTWIVDAAGMSKSSSAWAAGTGNGMLDTGSFAASTVYYLYRIWNPATSAVDYLMSLSASAPTMPAGFTKKRLIGAALTNVSTYFIAAKFSRPLPTIFQCNYLAQIDDRPKAAAGNTNRNLLTVSAPVNSTVLCVCSIQVNTTDGATIYFKFGSTFETDVSPGVTTFDLRGFAYASSIYPMPTANLFAIVDANRQVYWRVTQTATTSVRIGTKAWSLSL